VVVADVEVVGIVRGIVVGTGEIPFDPKRGHFARKAALHALPAQIGTRRPAPGTHTKDLPDGFVRIGLIDHAVGSFGVKGVLRIFPVLPRQPEPA
jgi:hypothetical protein